MLYTCFISSQPRSRLITLPPIGKEVPSVHATIRQDQHLVQAHLLIEQLAPHGSADRHRPRPLWTASMIWSKGTTVYLKSEL